MTRNEQILSEVQERYLSDYTHIASKINAFVEGANWADEHPKPESINKQEFVEKIWQWLQSHIKIETISYNVVGLDVSEVEILVTDFATIDEMKASFLKMMED